MIFLKTNIYQTQEILEKPFPQSYEDSNIHVKVESSVKLEDQCKIEFDVSYQSSSIQPTSEEKVARRTSLGPNSRHLSSTKNIAMNYGRAIASFAGSNLAKPYIEQHLQQMNLTRVEFIHFLKEIKPKIQSITGLRSVLLIEKEEDAKTTACKKLFQWLGEVFIKYFSVNWIIHGKVSHKMVYLKYRFKMLRRIQNPEQFNFIKERKPKTSNFVF